METLEDVETAAQAASKYCAAQRAELEANLARVNEVATLIRDQTGISFSTAYDHVRCKPGVNLWPDGHETSRKVVGHLIRALGMKPTFRKWDEAQAEARFELERFTIMVNNYKGRNCRLVEKEVIVEATAEQYIPAKPARIEKKIVMECDLESEV